MRPRLLRALGGLRVRMVVLLVAGQMIAACGFYSLFDFLARDWARHELERQSGTIVERLARDAATPLVLGDEQDLQEVAARETRATDVVGVSILDAQGGPIVTRVNEARFWTPTPPGGLPARWRDPVLTRHLVNGVEVYSLVGAVRRENGTSGTLRSETGEIFDPPGTAPDPTPRPQLIGWARLEYSTVRLETDLARARRLGLIVLFLALLVGLLAALVLLRVVVRPLREASDLAREIADGNLARRLPLRGRDELGALAESMNTMAAALAESRERERIEAATLRDTAEAVIAIAQGARAARDPASVFRIVAREVRRVTRCDGVALAMPEPGAQGLRFEYFEPAPPWGGLFRGAGLDPLLTAALATVDPPPLRLETAAHANPLTTMLAASGIGAALLVPLTLEGGPPAALLLVSREASAFGTSEVRVVTGLASHLCAALHADQLHDRLEKAFEELHHTQEQLLRSERLRVAGELASGIAHEFNNVLAAILGRVQLLRRRAEEGRLLPQELTDTLAILDLAARDGAETVRRLRQFGKGSDSVVAEPVDLGAAMREAVEFTRTRWKNEAESGGLTIDLEVESEPGAWVRGQASQLREVFTNLILNAADALPQGGRIRLVTAAREATVTAVVEDDGVGMLPETLQRAFEPFFTTKGVSGTGLGLSMVYGIVQRHGGKLNVRSHPGRGTRVELSFTRVAAPAAPTAVAADESAPATGLSVLVVDDETAVCDLLMDILSMLGHSVRKFESPEEALNAFEPGRYDLVLTDLGMPGMNGWQLSQTLRSRDPRVTIVFVTGWGEDLDPAQVRSAGADGVVGKPFSIADLERVTRLASGRGQKRAA